MKVTCPYCSSKYDIEDSFAGQQVECECGKEWTVEEPKVKSLKLTGEMKVISEAAKKKLKWQLCFAVSLLVVGILALTGIVLGIEQMAGRETSFFILFGITGGAILAAIIWIATVNKRLQDGLKQNEKENKKKQGNLAWGCVILIAFSVFGCVGMYSCIKSAASVPQTEAQKKAELGDKIEYMAIVKIKSEMHNPKSFELAGSHKEVNDNAVIVTMKFRGTNAFGAVVTQSALAIYDRHTDKLEVAIQ